MCLSNCLIHLTHSVVLRNVCSVFIHIRHLIWYFTCKYPVMRVSNQPLHIILCDDNFFSSHFISFCVRFFLSSSHTYILSFFLTWSDFCFFPSLIHLNFPFYFHFNCTFFILNGIYGYYFVCFVWKHNEKIIQCSTSLQLNNEKKNA